MLIVLHSQQTSVVRFAEFRRLAKAEVEVIDAHEVDLCLRLALVAVSEVDLPAVRRPTQVADGHGGILEVSNDRCVDILVISTNTNVRCGNVGAASRLSGLDRLERAVLHSSKMHDRIVTAVVLGVRKKSLVMRR